VDKGARQARGLEQVEKMVLDRGRDMHGVDGLAQLVQVGRGQAGREAARGRAGGAATEHQPFRRALRVTEREPQQEPVELRFGQRIDALLLGRVLGGDDEKRIGQGVRGAVHADLMFLHRFQQGALGARAGAVDLVGQQDFGEDRPGLEAEVARLGLVDGGADQVGGQQVAGELHSARAKAQRAGQRGGQGGLADPGDVLQQHMAAGQQGGQGKADAVLLAEQGLGHAADDAIECVASLHGVLGVNHGWCSLCPDRCP